MKNRHPRPTSALALILTFAPLVLHAAVDTIIASGDPTLGATGSTPNWGTAANWSLTALPGASDNVVISYGGATAAGVDIRGSSVPGGAATIQDLAFTGAGTGTVTLQNNSTGSAMTLTLNGGRGAGTPLISTAGYGVIIPLNGPGTVQPLTLQLAASGSIDVGAGGLTIGAILSETGGARGLNKTGAGTLTLSGVNTFTGGLTHSAGILRATTNAAALGAGTLTLAGAELQLANNTALAFNRNTTVTASTTIKSDRIASGAGVVHTLGTLSIGAQTLTISPGALSTGATAGIAFGATTLTGDAIFSVSTNALLNLGTTNVGSNLLTLTGAGPTTVAGVTSSGAANVAVTGGGAATIGAITSVGALNLSVSGAGIATLNGVNNVGTGGLVRTGTGRSILSGASTFNTGATLNAGITEVTNNGALGTGATVVNTGATLELNLAGSLLTASSITANAGGRVAVRGLTTNSNVTLAGGILGTRSTDVGTFAGAVNVTANSSAEIISYTTPTSNQSITIAGKLSGSSALAINGGVTANAGLKALILTNTTNDFSGAFNVASGQRLSSVPATTGKTLGTAAVNLTNAFLRLNDNGTGVDGILAYGNNISVITAGTLDLDRVSGVNTGNTFALGSLTSGAANLTINGGNGYKASFTGATLTGNTTITNNNGVSILGAVTGGFTLTKAGAGTLTLAGANSHGGTTISGGGLNLSGSLTGGLALGSATTLTGAGSVAGTTTVANTAVLNPGALGSGTFSTGGLTFGAAATDIATVNFTTNASPGNINVTGVGGLVANGGAGTVSLQLLSTLPAVGSHTIIDYDGAIGGTGFSAFTLGTLPNPRIVASLVDNTVAKRIELNVTAVDAPRWSGGVSGEWSTAVLGGVKNWNLVVGVGSTDYITGDNVLFNDNIALGGTTNVLLNVGDVTPASVVFDNSIPYSLSGSKAILGTTGLVKTNSGTLTISNTNNFTGPVSISTGTVSVSALADGGVNSPLGAGTTITLGSGGALEFNAASGSTNRPINTNAGGGKVKISGGSAVTLAGAITTAGGDFTLDNGGSGTISGAIGGTNAATLTGTGSTIVSGNITVPLTKTGAGTATLTGAANAPATTLISAGILQVGNGVAAGSTGTGVITNNATLAFDTPAAGVVVANQIVGSGGLTKTGAGNTTLSGALNNTYSGVTTVNGGTLVLSKTSGINAIGGDLVVETGGTVAYGTTAGQLQDHIPDTASITINGGTFGSGVGNTLAAPTVGVSDTVANVTVNSGSFISGRGAVVSVVPTPFTVTGEFKLLGGTAQVSRGGELAANKVTIANSAISLDGGSGTASQESRLEVGAGGLALTAGTINLNAGPSAIVAASVGSIVKLLGDVTSSGSSSFVRQNAATVGPKAVIDLNGGNRNFDVTAGTLEVGNALAPIVVQNGGLTKNGAGTMSLSGINTYAGDTIINAGTLALGANASILASPNVIVKAGAIFDTSAMATGFLLSSIQTLSGTGIVNGMVSTSLGSKLSPGESPGTLTINGNLNVVASVTPVGTGVMLFELDTPATSDRIQLGSTGTLSIGAGFLEWDDFTFTHTGAFAPGVYKLFDTSQPILGTLGTNVTGNIAGYDGTLSLGSGDTAVLLTVVVPEPASIGLLVLSAGLLVRRRRAMQG